MNGKAYEIVTSSIREAVERFRDEIQEGEHNISFENVMEEIVSNLEEKMREEGMKTSSLWDDCGI